MSLARRFLDVTTDILIVDSVEPDDKVGKNASYRKVSELTPGNSAKMHWRI
jgi:hypothetical protein